MAAARGSPMEVLFLTNRKPTDTGLDDGSVPGPVSWGIANCTAAAGSAEGWSWTFGKKSFRPLTQPQFLKTLRERLKPRPGKDLALLVHFHGAGCLAAETFCRAGNLAQTYGGEDLEIVPLMVSWSSGGFTPEDYVAARQWMAKDVRDLAAAFRALAAAVATRQPGVLALLTAHSLGGQLLSCILADCARRPDGEPGEADPPFDDALLFAVDVDNDALNAASPPPGSGLHRLDRWAREIHVYFSHADGMVGLRAFGNAVLPLAGSSGTAMGSTGPLPRVGQMPSGRLVDTVNCVFVPGATGPTQHHYWRLDRFVVEDVRAVIRQTAMSKIPNRSWDLFDRTWKILPPAGTAPASMTGEG